MTVDSDLRGTASAGIVRALTEFAVSKGADRDALLERARIRPEQLLDQDERIPMSSYLDLMRAGKELCRMPAIGLEFCEGTRFEEISIVGLVCQAAGTMGEALAELNRFNRLVVDVEGAGTAPRFEVVRRSGEVWLEDRRPYADRYPELTEAAFGRFVCENRRHFPDMPFAKSIHVMHAKPAHSADYERILKVPVVFGSDRNAMLIYESWLSFRFNDGKRYVFGVFSERAQALMTSLERSTSVRGRVESALMPLLHTGTIGMDAIAKQMNVSRQTLYRALKAEGVAFDRLRDDLRRRMASYYLSSERLSVSETAYLVGFSEPSAFSRAYKRWTGTSPALGSRATRNSARPQSSSKR